jgi:polar amino acid transport system permease protein
MTGLQVFWSVLTSSDMLSAAWTTIWLALAAQALGVIVGLILGPAQLSRWVPLSTLAWLYVWFFRGTAELLQIIAWYAVLPLVGIELGLIQIGILGLGLNEGARMAEIVRAGIISVHRGQWDAARSLGMSLGQTARYVIFPQAARVILPPTGNEINYMFKTTSLVSVIGIAELLRQSQLIAETQPDPLPIFMAAMIYYLAITSAWSIIQRWLESIVRYEPLPTQGPSWLQRWVSGWRVRVFSRP